MATSTAKKTAARKPESEQAAAQVDPDRDPRWEALTAPFPADQIEKLPKVLSREDRNKGRCQPGPNGQASPYSADGHHCGGWHSRAVHLDYVGHAGITMRLNEAVGPDNWSWEPLGYAPETGMPLVARGEFWIKLTVLGVTKLGVGDDFRSSKEAIGDALRNAAMRFGIATYLWSKSEAAHNLASNTEPTNDDQEKADQRRSNAEARQQGRSQGYENRGDAPAEARPPIVEPGDDDTPPAQQGTDPSVVKVQTIAAQRAADLGALRQAWDQACESGAVNATIADPDTGEEVTLGQYITRRKNQLQAATAA